MSAASHQCRHCKAAPGRRPRRLCWRCYRRKKLRLRYPSLSKFGKWADRRPEHRPLNLEGLSRVERLAELAKRRLPLFEEPNHGQDQSQNQEPEL